MVAVVVTQMIQEEIVGTHNRIPRKGTEKGIITLARYMKLLE